jgi:hypothetical protein
MVTGVIGVAPRPWSIPRHCRVYECASTGTLLNC